MNWAGHIALSGLVAYVAGLILGRSRVLVPSGTRFGTGSWGWAWVAMFLSVAVFVGHAYTSESVSLDRSAAIQLSWVGLACLLMLVSIPRARPWIGLVRAAPILLFLLYGMVGIATSMFSPRPVFSLYKAGLVVFDAILAAGLLSLVLRGQLKYPSNVVIGLIMLAIGGALVGAALWPNDALQPKPGVFGVMLYGVLPMLHPNELGMWAGVAMVISAVRMYVGRDLRGRMCWLLLCGASATVVLLAQSRTSVAAVVVSVVVLVPYMARTRGEAIAGTAVLLLGGTALVGMAVVILGADAVFGPIVEYLQRGQAEGGLATFHGRLWAWINVGWPMFMDSPMIGHGFDAGVRFASELSVGHLHNSYFQVLANSGLLGFLPWVAAVALVVVRVTQHVWRYRHAPVHDRAQAVIPLLILIGLAARSWTGSVLVSHAWSTMIFLAVVVEIYGARVQARSVRAVPVMAAVRTPRHAN